MTYREKLDAASGRRLFVAIPIPPSVRESIASVVDAVRAAGDPAVRDVRWVRLDGLHLTVRFIGPTDEERVAAVAAAVDRTARAIDPFDVVIANGGAFPSVGRPRALWLGISEGAAELGSDGRTAGRRSCRRRLAPRRSAIPGSPDPRPVRRRPGGADRGEAVDRGCRCGPGTIPCRVARALRERLGGWTGTLPTPARGVARSDSVSPTDRPPVVFRVRWC